MTADHGNADCMFELDKKTGEPATDADGNAKVKTSHTLNPVPLHVYSPGKAVALDARRMATAKPGLANLAATVLDLMGLEAPEDYEPSLLASD